MTEQENLKDKTKRGLMWSTIGNFANQGIRFVFGIILARLLSPDDYGVIGMLTIFMCIVSTFIDCGFSQALISKQNRTQADFSTEFFFNIGVGIVGYGILFLISPFVADFYNMSILSPVLKVVGLGVVINSLCVVQSAQFSIRLDFKTPAKISVISQLSSGAIGIALAYNGWGVWSLVFQQIMGGFFNAIMLWILAKWRPTLEFSKESFKYLWKYGSNVLGSSILSQIYDNIQPLIVGKVFNANTLGLYSRALNFAQLPSTNLSNILGNVTFPILTRINGELIRMANVYRRMIKVTGYVVFPLMIGLAAVSSPLVKVLLNDQWYGCIILLQITSISLMWQPISFINLNLLKAANRPDVVLKLELIKKPLGLVVLLVSAYFGIIPFALGNLVICVFAVSVNTIYTSKILKITFYNQIKDLSTPFIASIIMGLIVYITVGLIDNEYISLFVGVLIGVSCYLLESKLFMSNLMKDTLSMFVKKNR